MQTSKQSGSFLSIKLSPPGKTGKAQESCAVGGHAVRARSHYLAQARLESTIRGMVSKGLKRFTVVGFCCETQTFEIVCLDGKTLNRTFSDLRSLGRVHKNIIPSTVSKRLQCESWRFGGQGWRLNMSKTLNTLNTWLNEVLAEVSAADEFVNEQLYADRSKALSERIEREAPARRLQQYLCSDRNLMLLMTELRHVLREANVLVEPSFGDGRVLESMVAMAREEIAPPRVTRVVGVELDPVISSDVAQRLSKHESVKLFIQDFLTTTLESLGLENDVSVVVGSPPYTLGGGTGCLTQEGSSDAGDVGRDLPLRFLVHSATELRPRWIIFLNPIRCQRPAFIARALELMNSTNTQGEWRLTKSVEADDRFSFSGRSVTQPAVIQVFHWDQHLV